MKKSISILLAVLTLLSTFLFAVNASAASLTIDGKAYDDYYKVWWEYKDKNVARYNVFVDGNYDGTKKVNATGSYTFTTDPYTAGIKHTIQIYAINADGKVVAYSNKINRYLAPLVPTLTYQCPDSGYTITGHVDSGTVHGYALYKYNAAKDKYVFYKNFKSSIAIKASGTYKDIYRAKAYVTYAKTYYSQLSDYIACVPKLEGITLQKAVSKDPGKITLTWTEPKNNNFTGYQIEYSTYDSFSVFRMQGVDKKYTTYTMNLIPGICYKLRVRTYKTVSGGKVYGTWSGSKTLYAQPRVEAEPNVKYLLNYKVKVSKPGATGCPRLNDALDRILKKIGCGPDSTYYLYDKVRFAYRYIATEQFKKNGSLGAKGSSSYKEYSEGVVLKMLENYGSTGSCYEYNYLFHYLCLRMGLKNTYMVDGMVSSSGNGRTNHWWMMMKIAGNNYYFDPRMQRYMSSNTAINFFCLPLNGDNKYSDYFRFYDAKAELIL